MAYFADVREYLAVLQENGKVFKLDRQTDKDSEMIPLVRWEFRGLPENQRRAFWFTAPTDPSGRTYQGSALIACYAPSRDVYALGMRCAPEEIHDRWLAAQGRPIEPVVVADGPCREEVHEGDGLLEHGGFLEFPVPNSTPGFDNAPYVTAAHWVTKDPDTGVHNVGTYRSMVRGPAWCGVNATENQHLAIHRRRWREKGCGKMPAALVLGVVPSLAFTSVAGLPYTVSEYAMAGGIAGEPLKVVRGRTVDLLVPAHAEIVIEGEIDTRLVERDGPFGEYTGYMGKQKMAPFFEARCITHRKDPIYVGFLSQFPPSESSKLKQVANEAIYTYTLKHACNIPTVQDVAFHESAGCWQFCVIRMRKTHPSQSWQALHAAVGLSAQLPKIIIVVDEDIDPWDADSVNWAMAFRTQPHRDIEVVRGRVVGLDPSGAPADDPHLRYPDPPLGGSALLVDATRKFAYPPVSLPRRDFMERAREVWEKEGLPALSPRVPWYGYPLGLWSAEDEEEAELALEGRYFETSEKVRGTRRPDS